MNTILSFMDKLYSDSKTLSIVYVVGAVLLFIFIILLMLSLRKPDKKEKTKIIDEPNINNEETSKEKVEEEIENNIIEPVEEEKIQPLTEDIFEKTTIIPLNELEKKDNFNENPKQEEEAIKVTEEINEEIIELPSIASSIPDVDSFVDNVVKKTYEKNEQFSSVYVSNTSPIKLDKVMENLNIDEDVKESIIPEEEKTIKKEEISPIEPNIDIVEPVKEKVEEVIKEDNKPATNNSLDNLKKALEEKKKEVSLKQDDLKSKLESLKKEKKKSEETLKAEDLLNKLNSMNK